MLDPSMLGGGGAPAPPTGQDSQGGDPESKLRDALDLLTQAQQEETDDADTLQIQKAMVAIQSILGNRQKQDETAQGITPAHKAMGRAASAGGGGGGY